jgi:hypothetical protein
MWYIKLFFDILSVGISHTFPKCEDPEVLLIYSVWGVFVEVTIFDFNAALKVILTTNNEDP